MNDQSLAGPTPDQPADNTVFGNPNGAEPPRIEIPDHGRQMTVADILASARVPEKRASICVRADLQARYDEILAELGTLVNARGELLEDAEASMGEQTAASKAIALNDELASVRKEMAGAMWRPLFRGMTSDDLAVFNKEHYPKKEGADLADYNNRLVAACSADPVMTVEDVAALRTKLNFKAIQQLVRTATAVCTGDVDVPKLPAFSLNQPER